MKNIFESTASSWVKYSEYEYRESTNGILYITPTENAKLQLYKPFDNIEEMIIDALNVNTLGAKKSESELKKSVMDFVSKYGLLGFMTALPTTPEFVDYDAVYLPKNEFIEAETMSTQDYLNLFFPFNKPDFHKNKQSATWNITDDKEMMALALTMSELPMAVNICMGRDYAEQFDWLAKQFQSWAFTATGAILYYKDLGKTDDTTLYIYRLGMSAFKGITPTYHVALLDKPTIMWDFHSLLLGIQMMFSFMLTDEANPLRICKHCHSIYQATHHNAAFCSPACKNKFNVYKSRGKK